jgi:hypothetical protein
MILSFQDYLPVSDLLKILIVVMAVAVVAPSAASFAIVGLDRRESGATGVGNAMVAAGAAVLLVLVVIGVYALVNR